MGGILGSFCLYLEVRDVWNMQMRLFVNQSFDHTCLSTYRAYNATTNCMFVELKTQIEKFSHRLVFSSWQEAN